MVSTATTVPVAVLASLSVAMFVFIWWWFPRHYRKGVNADQAEMDAEAQDRRIALEELERQKEQARIDAGEVVTEPPRAKTADERLWELVEIHRQALRARHEQGNTPAGHI